MSYICIYIYIYLYDYGVFKKKMTFELLNLEYIPNTFIYNTIVFIKRNCCLFCYIILRYIFLL